MNVGSAGAVVRSAYRKQVERIAPPELVGREAELRELTTYCTEDGKGPYAWWRAPAWAGKSALMSTFVLHPPAGVQIVAFFIMAQLGDQDTRKAFTQVVLEQLAEQLEQALPPLTAATRDAHMLRMLEQAADACAARGERLILIVDGLDEDRRGTAGQDAHSIAALLPGDPPAGMRILVAGRPDPPIPDDVPGWHPLRDPGIVRPLSSSDYAQGVKALAERELKRLLYGTPAQQDLLGLLTAARGGLSCPDLAALTGEPLWEIEEMLRAVSGRTFSRQVSTWQHVANPEVYLLGHEELQATARTYLTGQRLSSYQDRLHVWADEYRGKNWSAGTPEYLLHGYFQMLTATGDTARMAACAADAARHERMSGITGGDAAGLNETTVTLDLISAQDEPDLIAALTLARHRDYLADRNTNIPTQLPAVWATIGQHIRAEALARSISDPDRRADALTAVARALAQAGQHQQATALARSITNPDQQASALTAVAAALAKAGRHQQATTMAEQAIIAARSITADRQGSALTAVARALAQAGQHQQATALARSITNPDQRAGALAAVASALAKAGQHQQATALARSITNPELQAGALAAVAAALAKAGQHDQATAVAAQATTAARSTTSPFRRAYALAAVAEALAQAGQHQQATTAARSITNPDLQAGALAAVAAALARARQHDQATAMAAQATTLARSITSANRQANALTAVARALAQAGQHQQATAAARSITGPDRQMRALAEVARALAQAGQHQQASVVAEEATTAARSTTAPDRQANALAEVDAALAQARQHQQALAAIAAALAQAGQHQQATAMAAQAITAARSTTDPDWQEKALATVAEALAQAGQHQQATALARSITDPYLQAGALAAVAAALAQAGQHDQATAVAAQATTAARSTIEPDWQASALATVAEALAQAGQHQQASVVAAQAITAAARSGIDPYWQANALPSALRAVAVALAQAGQHQQAAAAARSITNPDQQADALTAVARVLLAQGNKRHARRLAAAACATGRWTVALRLVLSLEPSAARVLTDLTIGQPQL